MKSIPQRRSTNDVQSSTTSSLNDRPINFGEAEAVVNTFQYDSWMNSIRQLLPKDVVWDKDVTAVVSLIGKNQVKVCWKARTASGGNYLRSMLATLIRQEISSGDASENSSSLSSEERNQIPT